jgi:monoterpene epsilon-lactone hydrolase
VARTRMRISGVDCNVFVPAGEARGTLVHCHGGGYSAGSLESSAPFSSRLAARTGAKVVCPDYALAPEQPFPAGLHDAVAVYSACTETDPEAVFVAGDSAGGGLAVALTLACRDQAFAPIPRGLLLLSPWVDLTVSFASYASRAETDLLFSAAMARECADLYCQDIDAAHPLISPVFADLKAMPPTLIFAGGAEILLDECIALAAALGRSNGDVELHVFAGMQHIWPTLFGDLPETDQAMEIMANFVARRT